MAATLLLADDSITIQRVVELTFADENIRVISAGDGQQAIQRIDTERPDIVLADVGMPKVDGYGVASHVKQTPALRHIPVILLTGAFEPIDEEKARATGCDGILVKPFAPEVLIARVRELLAGQRHEALWPTELPRVEDSAAPVITIVSEPVAVMPPPVHDTSWSASPPEDAVVVSEAPAAPAPVSVTLTHTPIEATASTQQDMLRPANRNPPQASPRQQAPRDLPPPADVFESELDMLDVALSRLEPTASPNELDAETASDFARDLEALRNEQPGGDLDDAFGGDTAPASAASRPMFGDWDLPGSRASRGGDADLQLSAELDRPIDIIPEEVPASFVMPPPLVPEHIAPPPVVVTPEPVVAAPPPRPVLVPPPAPIITPEPVVVVPAPVAPPAPVIVTPAPVAVQPVPMPVPAPVPVATPVVVPAPAPAPVAVAAPVAVPVPVAVPAPVIVAPAPPAPRPTLANAFSALLAAERAQPPARTLASPAALSETAIEEVVKRVLARMADEAVHKVVLDAAERLIREEIEHLKSTPPGSGR